MSSFSNPLTEYSPQMEFGPPSTTEFEDESELFDESQELEWTSRLLEASNEEQLDHFLHNMIREAGAAAGAATALHPSDAQAIAGVLKQAVREVLPASMPHAAPVQTSVGARLGRGLSSMAGQVLGLELEGLSPEDREFEAVKQFVRFAGQTVKNALEVAPGGDPLHAAHHAATDAAQIYAPGLFPESPHAPGNSGRWVACHDRIILFGL